MHICVTQAKRNMGIVNNKFKLLAHIERIEKVLFIELLSCFRLKPITLLNLLNICWNFQWNSYVYVPTYIWINISNLRSVYMLITEFYVNVTFLFVTEYFLNILIEWKTRREWGVYNQILCIQCGYRNGLAAKIACLYKSENRHWIRSGKAR